MTLRRRAAQLTVDALSRVLRERKSGIVLGCTYDGSEIVASLSAG